MYRPPINLLRPIHLKLNKLGRTNKKFQGSSAKRKKEGWIEYKQSLIRELLIVAENNRRNNERTKDQLKNLNIVLKKVVLFRRD